MKYVNQLKERNPLVLCLTNYVTTDFVANTLLSIGASPLMSNYIDELEDLLNISDSLYINIGTLDKDFVNRAIKASQIAKKLGKPIVLDPTGSGASKIRTETSRELMQYADIIKGNASEIISLTENLDHSKGVDSSHSLDVALVNAKDIVNKYNNIVIITGSIDYIIAKGNSQINNSGVPIMTKITGMGCALGAVIAGFTSIEKSPECMLNAVNYYGKSGEEAFKKCTQIGQFKGYFLNELNNYGASNV